MVHSMPSVIDRSTPGCDRCGGCTCIKELHKQLQQVKVERDFWNTKSNQRVQQVREDFVSALRRVGSGGLQRAKPGVSPAHAQPSQEGSPLNVSLGGFGELSGLRSIIEEEVDRRMSIVQHEHEENLMEMAQIVHVAKGEKSSAEAQATALKAELARLKAASSTVHSEIASGHASADTGVTAWRAAEEQLAGEILLNLGALPDAENKAQVCGAAQDQSNEKAELGSSESTELMHEVEGMGASGDSQVSRVVATVQDWVTAECGDKAGHIPEFEGTVPSKVGRQVEARSEDEFAPASVGTFPDFLKEADSTAKQKASVDNIAQSSAVTGATNEVEEAVKIVAERTAKRAAEEAARKVAEEAAREVAQEAARKAAEEAAKKATEIEAAWELALREASAKAKADAEATALCMLDHMAHKVAVEQAVSSQDKPAECQSGQEHASDGSVASVSPLTSRILGEEETSQQVAQEHRSGQVTDAMHSKGLAMWWSSRLLSSQPCVQANGQTGSRRESWHSAQEF